MDFVSFLLMQLLAAYTVLVEPFLRTNFYRNLKKRLSIDPSTRILFYRTQVMWELSWIVVIAIIMIPIDQPLQWLGLTLPNPMGWVIMAALLLGIGLSTYLLRRNPGALEAMRRSLVSSSILLPTTPAERQWYAVAAITAGICEELLFRGFLMRYVLTTFAIQDWLFIALISGIIYGLSRAYQGFKGIFQTALTGFSFAVVYALSESLLPAMVFHILAELRTMFLWQPEEVKKKSRA
jgi:uncharacterized protein